MGVVDGRFDAWMNKSDKCTDRAWYFEKQYVFDGTEKKTKGQRSDETSSEQIALETQVRTGQMIQLVFAAMSTYRADSLLQLAACKAIAVWGNSQEITEGYKVVTTAASTNAEVKKGRSQVLKAINHVLDAMQEHHMDCAVQEAALLALMALGSNHANLMRINGAGGRAKVSDATAASNATDETKECGKKLSDKLKAAEETEKKAKEDQAKRQALVSQVKFMRRLAQIRT